MSVKTTPMVNIQAIKDVLNIKGDQHEQALQQFFHDALNEIKTIQHSLEQSWQPIAAMLPDTEETPLPTALATAIHSQMPATVDKAAILPALHTLERTTHKLCGVACHGHVPRLHQQCQAFGLRLRSHLHADEPLTPTDCLAIRSRYQALLDEIHTIFLTHIATDNVQDFLCHWDAYYQSRIDKLSLFHPDITQQWTTVQRQRFVLLFYHARGHFYKFLWLLGNEAPTSQKKSNILDNIKEEFGGDGLSHEKLYEVFAQALGVDSRNEFLHNFHYVPYLKAYNLGHLTWLNAHDWEGKAAAFSAYERLDNIDYHHLENLVKSFGITGKGLAFFKVHNKADHFDRTYAMLKTIWHKNRRQVEEAFAFIGCHQINMWQWLDHTLQGAL